MPTSTSSFGENYFQATYSLLEYKKSIENNIFPIARHYKLSRDDVIRRTCNFSLQCNQMLDIKSINKEYNVNFVEYFKKEIPKIKLLEEKGFLSYNDDFIIVKTLGRYFIRHICQIFDTFLDDDSLYQIHGN